MMRRLNYLLAVVMLLCTALFSCIDDNLKEDAESSGKINVSLKIVLPSYDAGSRAGGDNQYHDHLDYNTKYQMYIADVWILVFSKDASGNLVFDGLVQDLTTDNNQGAQIRSLQGTYRTPLKEASIAVLTNLTHNIPKAPDFKAWVGLTEQEIYEKLVYEYPESGLVLSADHYLPMWGKADKVLLNQGTYSASLNLYRAVAKMGVTAKECNTFNLKKVYVYFDNNTGYCAAPHQKPDEKIEVQYRSPDIPVTAHQFEVSEPQVYDVTDDMTMNQIYLSEVSNKHNKHPMKIVVGGIYTGEGLVENPNMSYYRIDLEDNFNDATGVKDPTLPLIPFDIIRNHSYIFNITQVDNPGTPTPDTALDSDVARLKVEILDYIKLDMKGLPDQYTLSTDKSVILFDNAEDVSPRPLEITTDYEGGWEIEPVDGNSEIPDWVVIDMKNGPSGTKTINISPKRMNRSITREAHFYVTAGKIRKEITVVHPQPPTANCYLASGKDNELIVGIIGNGETGTHPEGQNILEGKADATLTPYRIGIIWETKAGLVKLQDPRGNEVSNTSGKLTLVDYDRETMSIKYNVYPEVGSIGGKQGGNALIGAFDENGKVLWSWHIWVCPDVVSREGNTFNEDYLEHWKVNDYDFMDRNLGALANRPNESAPENQKGVAAMGLLYQWGRKDPFIGPNYSNDNFSGEGRIDVVHYYQEWETYASPSTDTTPIAYTIEHPTHLIWRGPNSKPNGLSQIAENGSYLWGTNGGFSTTIIELGSKTIYDPCPVGYRVPPVNAFVFKSPILNVQNANNGLQKRAYVRKKNENLEKVFISWSKSLRGPGTTYVYKAKVNPSTDAPAGYDYYSYYQVIPGEEKTSLESNWNENLRYIPHKVKFNRPWWGDGKTASMWNYEGFDWNNNYIKNAKYYGFYINYKKIEEPESVPDDMYHLRNDNPNEIAWFPLTGAYDPTKGVKFKDGNNTVSIQHGSSISVNSFLWSNSSVKNDGRDIPAAMFLHGTESGTNTTLGSGRHIHGMMQSNVKADPHYAGAVRCIKDRTKTEWSENRLTPQVTIKSSKGSSTEITIVSVSSNWILTEPGAPWLVVSPDRGAKTDKNGRNIKITMLKDMPAGSSTTLTFRIAAETEPRKVVVTVT